MDNIFRLIDNILRYIIIDNILRNKINVINPPKKFNIWEIPSSYF